MDKEDYALSILKREQQIIFRDTQLQGPGSGIFLDPRLVHLESLGNAIALIERKKSGK